MRMGPRWAGPAAVLSVLAGASITSSSAPAQEGGLPPATSSVAEIPDISMAEIPDIRPGTIAESVPEDSIPLFLSVVVNGRETDLIAEFALSADRRLSSVSSELEEVGIRAPGRANRRVYLDEIAGLSYRYDEASQTLEISAAPAALLPTEIAGRPIPEFVESEAGGWRGSQLSYHSQSW